MPEFLPKATAFCFGENFQTHWDRNSRLSLVLSSLCLWVVNLYILSIKCKR